MSGDKTKDETSGTAVPGPDSGLRTPPSGIERNQRETAKVLRDADTEVSDKRRPDD
ncbi:hypothetical protein JL101_011215 [Skermanella rosea]|uniref:hypothetical protein n=1 Tax=Skermanella rosea TaxID=1817965 RepID=UPI0019329319|nr:hypothetical protein [Skermanella rosea]UEM05968.1 hypothetical protein JL101_011215 [Skermanella rosea]